MLFFLTATMYRCIIISIGVLYPAFNSYKALNRKDGYEQVKLMMYWIAFAAFTACEVVTDVLFSWLPLYDVAKICFLLWMVLPMTRGSSYLYRKVIHPHLLRHEPEIDRYIASASNTGCNLLLEFGQHGINFAANAVLRTAGHLKRSYSVGDVSDLSVSALPTALPRPTKLYSGNVSPPVVSAPRTGNSVYLMQNTIMDMSEAEPSVNHITAKPRTTRKPKTKKAASNADLAIGGPGQENAPSVGSASRRAKRASHKLDEDY